MAEPRVDLYEGLFLLNQQAASSDFGGCVDFIRQVFQRAEAEVLVLRKWDERKLAFEIRGQKRGIYILAYFKARGTQIANIERDCTLSEQVLRALILKADHIGETEIEVAKKDADLSLEAKLRSPAPGSPAPGSAAPTPGSAGAGTQASPAETRKDDVTEAPEEGARRPKEGETEAEEAKQESTAGR